MSACGLKVGAAKVTGTGAGCDRWAMVDAGARVLLDFTDAGYPSTHRLSAEVIEGIVKTLVSELCLAGVDAIVLEVADGLFLHETADLVRSDVFRTVVDGVMLADVSGEEVENYLVSNDLVKPSDRPVDVPTNAARGP